MRRYMRRSLNRKEKAFLLLFCICAVMITLTVVAMAELRPLLTRVATSRVSNTITRIVNESVNKTLYEEAVNYDQLISFEKDLEGHITAVKSNMAEFNRLQSMIIQEVLEKISEVSTREISIPIGSLTGNSLLAGRGPALHIRMQSIGSSAAHFENAFSSAGINQTKHEIILVVEVNVSILLPGFTTATRVSNTFSVAETVIVGSVPDTYTYFNSTNEMEDIANDYIMNKG